MIERVYSVSGRYTRIAFFAYLVSVLLFPSTVFAGAVRSIDADSITSSDKTKTYSLPAASDALIGSTSAATLSNKTISGAANTFVQVPTGSNLVQVVPTGNVDGTNTTFTITPAPPASGAVQLTLNGLTLTQGSGNDYTLSGSTITMTSAPAPGQKLLAIYSQY